MIKLGEGSIDEKKVVAVAGHWRSIPAGIKRRIDNARNDNKLIDLTFGRKTETVIFTDNDQVILTYIDGEEVNQKIQRSVDR